MFLSLVSVFNIDGTSAGFVSCLLHWCSRAFSRPELRTTPLFAHHQTIARVFHRMDDLLKGAAAELLRSQGMRPEEGGDVSAAGATAAAAAAEVGEGAGGRQSDNDSLETVPSASTSSGATEEKDGGRVDGQEGDVGGEGKVGTADRGGQGETGGARAGSAGEEKAGAGAEAEAEVSVERAKEILRELSEFRQVEGVWCGVEGGRARRGAGSSGRLPGLAPLARVVAALGCGPSLDSSPERLR